MIRRLLASVATLGLVAGLGGCALLSTPDPIQTYRFGANPAAEAPVATTGTAPVAVSLRRVSLPEASRGDRILGVTGTETAYIKGVRWVSSAETLLDDSLRASFAARPGRVRLLGGRDVGAANRVLSLEVTAFEARYAVPGGVPQVVISARGRMASLPDRTIVEDRVFTVVQPASSNRISAITEAFDIAARDFGSQVAEWTETQAPTAAPRR